MIPPFGSPPTGALLLFFFDFAVPLWPMTWKYYLLFPSSLSSVVDTQGFLGELRMGSVIPCCCVLVSRGVSKISMHTDISSLICH